jgi:methyl-accepting chemotaxis protein
MTKGWLWRRRNYLINKDFQFRYIGRNLFALTVMALVISFTVYYTTWARIMDEFYNIPRIAAQFAPLFATVNQIMLVILVAFFILAAIFSVFASHAIAGPIYRFEKALQSMAQGDFTLKVGLRKTDEFKHMADSMNSMITELRSNISSDSELIQELAAVSERLSSADSGLKKDKTPATVIKDLEKLNQILARLQENVSRFKLPETEL